MASKRIWTVESAKHVEQALLAGDQGYGLIPQYYLVPQVTPGTGHSIKPVGALGATGGGLQTIAQDKIKKEEERKIPGELCNHKDGNQSSPRRFGTSCGLCSPRIQGASSAEKGKVILEFYFLTGLFSD